MDFQLSRDHFRENHFSGFFSSRSCFLRLTKMNDHFSGFFSRRRPRSFYWYFFSPEPMIIFVDHFAVFSSNLNFVCIPFEALRKHVRGAVENSKAESGVNNADSRHVFGVQLVLMVSLAITMGSGTGGATTKGKGFWRRPSLPAKSSSQSQRL